MQRRLGHAVSLPRVNEMGLVNCYSFSITVPDAGVKVEKGRDEKTQSEGRNWRKSTSGLENTGQIWGLTNNFMWQKPKLWFE